MKEGKLRVLYPQRVELLKPTVFKKKKTLF